MDRLLGEFDQIMESLKWEMDYYTALIEGSPSGGLIRADRSGKLSYLHCIPDGVDERGRRRYIKKTITNDTSMLSALLLKEYSRSAMRIIGRNLHTLQSARGRLLPYSNEAIRRGMRKAYRGLPAQEDPQIRFDPLLMKTAGLHIAKPGLHVAEPNLQALPDIVGAPLRKARKKEELLIEEKLFHYDIPFRFRQKIQCGIVPLAPAFSFTGMDEKDFYWEHYSRMDEPAGVERFLRERSIYERYGITQWDNMICTFSKGDHPDMKEIDTVIRTKILPRLG